MNDSTHHRSYCGTTYHYQSPFRLAAVSRSYITNKYAHKFQPTFFHEDIESSSIGKPTSQNEHQKLPLETQKLCVKCSYCTCLPKWARYALWSLVLILLLVIIVVGSIFATFKMPTFSLVGLISAPGRNMDTGLIIANGKFSYHFYLEVIVDNPNIFPLHFSKMNATAYYPTASAQDSKTLIGNGYLPSQWIPAESTLTVMYPFHIDYDPSSDADQGVLNSLTDKCGLMGNKPQDLSIDYSIHLTASALFVAIQPVISSSAQFPCPINPSMLDRDENPTFMQDSISNPMLSLLG